MALSTKEICALVGEVRRVLRPGGVFVYTVRHTRGPHYGAGTALEEGELPRRLWRVTQALPR
ncbi:hypothetical protein [Streptomyces melanogenes]|uniref:hypothetical protein n=1 Tax=Streptomyces melanogenes TaxID=67326 RepID=UPI0037A00783